MIIINLLPVHLRPVKRTPLPHIVSLSVLAVTVLGLAGAFLAGQAKIGAQQDQLDQKQLEFDGLKDVVKEHNEAEKTKEEFKERFLAVKEILKDRVIWSEQLDKLASLTPDNIWYKALRLTEKPYQEMKIKTDAKGQPVMNKDTGKPETELVPGKRSVLEVSGYSKPDDQGHDYIYELISKAGSDPGFSRRFEVTAMPKIERIKIGDKLISSFTQDFNVHKVEEGEAEGEGEA